MSQSRREFIGGSDAAAVLGVSPWTSPLDLYLEKTGQAPTVEEEDAAREKVLARGKRLEPVIIEMALDKLRAMGLRVEEAGRNHRYVDGDFPFLQCEIDFRIRVWGEVFVDGMPVMFAGETINADAKSVSHFQRDQWGVEHTEEIPVYYAAQFMHGMGITGAGWCLVAALRSLDDVDLYWLRRDEETLAGMRQKCVEFWGMVQNRIPPPPINLEDVRTLFPRDDGSGLVADDDLVDAVEGLRAAKSAKKEAEAVETALQLRITQALCARSALLHPTTRKVLATFKAQTDGRRVLRLPEPRKNAR